MKLVHAADLHLDSPLRGLTRYPGAPVDRMRGATREALANLVQLCVDERAGLLVIAGDLYDGEWQDYSTGLFFAAQMARLAEAGAKVVWIRGNHDAASVITRHLRLPANVRELAFGHAETASFDDLGVAVHGQGFVKREVLDDLASAYPDRIPSLLNVGLLHTALEGREGHGTYAPTTLSTLRAKGYDYWALGHVHAREVVSRDPWVVFPGNLQGRHAKETGEKGATVVTYDERGIQSVVHHALDVVRYASCEVDLGGVSQSDDAHAHVRDALSAALAEAQGRTLAARVTLTGATDLHAAVRGDPEAFENDVRSAATELGGGELWVEKIVWRTQPRFDVDALRAGVGGLAELSAAIDALRKDEAGLSALCEAVLADLRTKWPLEARTGHEAVKLDDPTFLKEQLDEVEALLLGRLVGTGGDRK